MSNMEILSVSNVNQLKLFFTARPVKSRPKNHYPTNATKVLGWALLDSGASLCFINKRIVQEHRFVTQKNAIPKKLCVIDGRKISSGIVDSECNLELLTGNHVETISFNAVDLGDHPIVLGMSWLRVHNPSVDWKTEHVAFSSPFCSEYCLPNPTIVQANRKPKEMELFGEAGIPALYAEFASVFSKEEASQLPPHWEYDLHMDLEEGATPKWGALYNLSQKEDAELCDTLEKQLRHGLIRLSKSPMSSPVLFVKKKSGKLRMCVDYRKLNTMTIKNRYPLPLTHELIEKLKGAKVFTKLDLKSGYNLVCIRQGDEWKTAFRTKYGLFEYLVMPFSLTNAPAAFQHLMNDIFRDLLDVYVIIYLDDILIFSRNPEDHVKHTKEVLRRLKQHGLYCNAAKCTFDVPEVDYLGLIVSGESTRVDPERIKATRSWPIPRNVKNVQEFLGFANFYRRFIEGYTNIATPLYALMHKDQEWRWGEPEQKAFDAMKDALSSAPVLAQPDPLRPFFMECDASDFATGAVLSQKVDGKLKPVAFLSKSLSPAEKNYGIYDKELLAVIRAFKECRYLLEGSEVPVEILTDHKNLEYFMSTKILNRCQVRWANFLADYNFRITYRPGAQNKKADILSRRVDWQGTEGGGEPRALLQPEQFSVYAITPDAEIEDLVREAIDEDPRVESILRDLRNDKVVEGWELVNGLLFYKGRIFVPKDIAIRKLVLELHHDAPAAGHPGQARTLELVSRRFESVC
jgi:hypothetical protein